MIDKLTPLAEKLLGSEDFSIILDGIMENAKSSDMEGDDLLGSLVASGAVAGIERAQKYFIEESIGSVKYAKLALKHVDEAMLCVGDEEGREALVRLRKRFSDALSEHSKMMYERYIESANKSMGLPRKYLEHSGEAAKHSRMELQVVGFIVYQHAPLYFKAWSYFNTSDSLASLECRCMSCLVSGMMGKAPDAAALLSTAVDMSGGLDNLFCEFGSFVILDHRARLADITEGITDSHSYSETEADKDALEVITRLRSVGKD